MEQRFILLGQVPDVSYMKIRPFQCHYNIPSLAHLRRPSQYQERLVFFMLNVNFIDSNSDGHLRHCVGKSKLMSILESSLPDQCPDQEEDRHQHAGKSVVIIDGMAVVQSMGKPTWVCNGRDLASRFLEIIDNRSKECDSQAGNSPVSPRLQQAHGVPNLRWCSHRKDHSQAAAKQ